MIIESAQNTILCKYCNSNNLVKVGTYNHIQLYFCKSCRRKFKDDESLFHSKVPAQCIYIAFNMYYNDRTINDIRYYLKNVYDYFPSKSVVFGWIQKYSELVRNAVSDYKPLVGDVWEIGQDDIRIGREKIWILAAFDQKTAYLLALLATPVVDITVTRNFLQQAIKCANKIPKIIFAGRMIEQLKTSGLEFEFNKHIEFKHKVLPESSQSRKFISLDSLNIFLRNYRISWNYMRQIDPMQGRTPARAAGIDYGYESWADIIQATVQKESQ